MNLLDTLLINACIVTQNPQREILTDAMLGVRDGKIACLKQMGTEPLPKAKRIVDCRGGIVLPGLIDGHGHAGHPMTKHISTDSLQYWGRCAERIYFFYSTPEFWYYDALLSAMERVRFGVTTGISVIANQPRADSLEIVRAHLKGYAQVGSRTIACTGPGANDWPKPLAQWDGKRLRRTFATWETCMENTETLLRTEHLGNGGRQRIFVTPFTIVPSIPTWGRTTPELTAELTEFDRKQLHAVRALARKYQTSIHTDAFGNGVEMMAQSEDALLGEDVLLQHCYDLNEREVNLLAQTHTNVGHSPEQSNHFCPFTELLEAGANAIITSDGNGPRVTFDMFEHMRRAQELEMMRFGDVDCMTAQTLLDGVTIQAAKALRMDREIGSLECGKRADLILLDPDAPYLSGKRSPLEKCVYAASGLDVQSVMVDGEFLLENGDFPTLEKQKILETADAYAKETIENAGLIRFIRQEPVFRTPYQNFAGAPVPPPPQD